MVRRVALAHRLDVDVGTDLAAVDPLDMIGETAPPHTSLGDHRLDALHLPVEGLDLAIDSGDAIEGEGAPLRGIVGAIETFPIPFAGSFVLEKLLDLGQAETGVVAKKRG